jgi:hypothetical protein
LELQKLRLQSATLEHLGSKQRLGSARVVPLGLAHAPPFLQLDFQLACRQAVQNGIQRQFRGLHRTRGF